MLAERIEEHDRSLIHLGRNEGIQEVVYALLKKGINKELITEVSGIPLDKLENLEAALSTN